MAVKKCEECGAKPSRPYEMFDYCARCGRDLCKKCMEEGCCGSTPATSGMKVDFGDDDKNAWEEDEAPRA